MNNLRVFSFERDGDLEKRDGDLGKRAVFNFDEVFTEVVSKPSLHTLIATYLPSKIPPLNPLIRLRCIDFDRHELRRAIKAAPYVESLAISNGEIDVDVSEFIPWTTLRQLGFCNTDNWAHFLDGFAVSTLGSSRVPIFDFESFR